MTSVVFRKTLHAHQLLTLSTQHCSQLLVGYALHGLKILDFLVIPRQSIRMKRCITIRTQKTIAGEAKQHSLLLFAIVTCVIQIFLLSWSRLDLLRLLNTLWSLSFLHFQKLAWNANNQKVIWILIINKNKYAHIRTWTWNLLIRSQARYPITLHAHDMYINY